MARFYADENFPLYADLGIQEALQEAQSENEQLRVELARLRGESE